ncbi:MAG: TlpA family protein disulfide reductase [Candidatus Omnitrophica bacterium]|nr:TlpA family protein disulfide reductase [Candidatus Omnitrophota bacterium]
MKKKQILFIFLLLGILGLSSGIFFRKSEKGREESTFSPQASDFLLPDLSGQLISLKSFPGRVILLTFWRTDCPYCRREIPILKRIQAKYNEKDVKVISVIIGEDPRSVDKFKQREEISYSILLDEDREVAHLYKVIGVPTDIIIDRAGKIVYYNFFWPKDLEEIIESLL